MQVKFQDIDFYTNFWKDKEPLTDSRMLFNPAKSIFFALKGKQQDGHAYIDMLYEKGLRCFVVKNEIDTSAYPDAVFLSVNNPLPVLQAWAAWHRAQFKLNVIAITGSNGKTIVKEWLYQFLELDFKVVKSPKSYNSQLGVPLSVLQIQASHQLGIFEAGISLKREMKKLEPIINPKIGIFTNIGQAHAEGFDSLAEKIEEKLILFKAAQTIIYCSDDETVHAAMLKAYPEKELLHWGFGEQALIQVRKSKKNQFHTTLAILSKWGPLSLNLPFNTRASIENAMHCIVLMCLLDYNNEQIQNRLLQLRDVPMRLEWKEAIRQSMLIDDTYNNDLGGLRIALEFMNQKQEQPSHYKKTAGKTIILSDLLEMGISDPELYRQVAKLLKDFAIQKIIAVGPSISRQATLFCDIPERFFFKDTDALLAALGQELDFHNEVILIKGARKFEFERIVRRLRKRSHSTVLELDLKALRHNFNVYRSLLKKETKLMVMVKASAYGSGSYEVARFLEYHKVDYLGVAYADEGVHLRERGISLPIMVMNTDTENFDDLLRYQIEPAVYSLEMFSRLLHYLERNPAKLPLPIHIEFDSGMHRLGFEPKDFDALVDLLQAHKDSVKVVGVFSHLAAAEESTQQDFSKIQIAEFEEFALQIEKVLAYPVIKHILNSAGISRFPDKQLDMVRLGIGLHGLDPNQLIGHRLEQVATLRTMVSQVKNIKAGASVGYGRAFVAATDCQIATIAIGYADGFWRAFSNGVGQLLIAGRLCPVVGKVCMDMCFADVSGLEVAVGDDVIVFGNGLPIGVVAAAAQTIPYEILTHISPRVPRVFFEQ